MPDRFDELVKLAQEGRKLKDEDKPVGADSHFDYWVHRVSEHLQKEFNAELALEWQSLPDSPLVYGGHYHDDDQSWALFNNVVKQRLAWIASLPSRLTQRELAPERIQLSAAAAGRREIQFDTKSRALVDPDRIEELKRIRTDKFDFSKLVRMCEELNVSYATDCYFAVAMLTRAILDHIPPIFGSRTFSEISNNYAGTRSFKASMQNLENSSRNIADQHLHSQIRSHEVLANAKQVDFSNDLDVLLSEIVRLHKPSSNQEQPK